MQAYHIDPVARTIALVTIPEKTADVAALLHTDAANLGIVPLQDSEHPTDLLIVCERPVKGKDGFFLAPGFPCPIRGDAYVVGVSHPKPVAGRADLCQGDPCHTPNVALDALREGLIWLRIAPEHSRDGIMAFEAVDVSPAAVLGMLHGLKEHETKGNVAISVSGNMDMDRAAKAIRSKLH